jgi:gentisate 1,2-dioxygenase
MSELGTLDELPRKYIDDLSKQDLVPLWPFLRGFLPHGIPERKTQPSIWHYDTIRPLLHQAGELTPIEKAERRVLVLCNPGHKATDALITPTIYVGLQLIKPGEVAPNHKHSPSAVRLVVEGSGGYTMVDGQKLPMEPGDLILTPPGLFHEHGHEGDEPVIWMDALDLPLIYNMEASYSTESESQSMTDEPDASQTNFRRSGLLDYTTLNRQKQDYPLLRFPWKDTREALIALSKVKAIGEMVHLAYINPETGEECMPVLGFSAIMLRPSEEISMVKRSASSVFKVVEGEGEANIDGQGFYWNKHDIMAVPTHSKVSIKNNSASTPAFLFLIDDAPLQRKIKIYEEFS